MKSVLVLALAVAATAVAVDAAPRLVEGISTPDNEYNYSVDAAGRTMVFARSEADFANARIFIAERRRGRWQAPLPLDLNGGAHRDSDPWLTPDGRVLYFISDRPAPGRDPDRRDFDVWRSVRSKAGWATPERLGDAVNSRGEELGPELHGGVLYFNSARRSGHGGLDVYAARAGGDGFVRAEPLPKPINSDQHDSDFTMSSDGSLALFWSTRGGKADLYAARRAGDGWSEPVRLPDTVNAGPFQFTPALSRDGRRLTYASTRSRAGQPEGMADIYEVATEGLLP